jgi:hypothetical protein
MTEFHPAKPVSGLSGRWIVLAIAAVCLLPLAAAMYLRFVSPPSPAVLAATPLAPFEFPFARLRQTDGQALQRPAVSEQWLVVYAAPGACAQACRDALYLTRQARAAQGRNMARIQRIWITDGTSPEANLLAAHPDLRLLQTSDPDVLQPPGQEPVVGAPSIYLVDRRGFVVFRYASTVDPAAFIRELGKLVKF